MTLRPAITASTGTRIARSSASENCAGVGSTTVYSAMPAPMIEASTVSSSIGAPPAVHERNQSV